MSFRKWLGPLRAVRGERPLWPVLLGLALDEEFQRQCACDLSYRGEVAICRVGHQLADGDREERLVARLFRSALASGGCVTLGGESIWLLGFQWPTQGGAKEKGRRADLVGMTRAGGLVVFEAKKVAGEPPVAAITEGLDYLACLLRPTNFGKIRRAVHEWSFAGRRSVPHGFEGVLPDHAARPTLVILAPEAYFTNSRAKGIRFREWPMLVDICESWIPSVRVRFAATDFDSVELWNPPVPKNR